jgi:hypothetical protein
MKVLSMAVFLSLIGAAPGLYAQPTTPAQSETGESAEREAGNAADRDTRAPVVGGQNRSAGRAGDSVTSGVSGPDDGASDSGSAGMQSSGGSGSASASGSGEGADVRGKQGSGSNNPDWQGIGSTGGATGTGASIGIAGEEDGTGTSRNQPNTGR